MITGSEDTTELVLETTLKLKVSKEADVLSVSVTDLNLETTWRSTTLIPPGSSEVFSVLGVTEDFVILQTMQSGWRGLSFILQEIMERSQNNS